MNKAIRIIKMTLLKLRLLMSLCRNNLSCIISHSFLYIFLFMKKGYYF
jgi:hypothetical protein